MGKRYYDEKGRHIRFSGALAENCPECGLPVHGAFQLPWKELPNACLGRPKCRCGRPVEFAHIKFRKAFNPGHTEQQLAICPSCRKITTYCECGQ